MSLDFPELRTDRLRLREITPDDLGAVMAIYSDPEVTRWLPWNTFRSVDTAMKAIDWMRGLRPRDTGIRWALSRRDDPRGEMIGSVGFDEIRRPLACAELGGELHRSAWGHGYAIEAIDAMITYGFECEALHRIETWTTDGNTRVLGTLRRAGFRHEGLFRAKGYWKGAFHDLHSYAVLRSDDRPEPFARD